MLTIQATVPCLLPPTWAVLERKLIDVMNQSVHPFLSKYTRAEDGELIWRERLVGRDGADDFYESFYNWPLLYLLGGDDELLALSHRQWDAVTRQLTRSGQIRKEYEVGYDQFHQGESYIYFYFLCLADPTNQRLIERARRFAGFYLNEDPQAPNYDPEHRLIRAPHNGSGGPRWGFADYDGEPAYGWSQSMRPYGLPYEDVPGVSSYEDLKDAQLAQRMGKVMQERMSKGDVAGNLCVTSLIANAYLMTGDQKYRQWVTDYVSAWTERAQKNGGLLPDNVGLSGEVGEYINGKWYGGLYGWSWPHGFYNIEMAALIGATNAYLLTRDPGYLNLPRVQLDRIMALGATRDIRELQMSIGQHWIGQIAALEDYTTFVVPYRYMDSGWFDYQPMSPVYPAALWNVSGDMDDWNRLETLRLASRYDWREVIAFRGKEDCGHEQPWLRYLAGDNADYPEAILRESYGMVCRRMDLIRADQADLTQVNIHHWQQLNPVITEALVQLTTGAPQIIYNGGLLMCRLRYFDLLRKRPGLPDDVAALVEKVDPDRTVVKLVNLSPFESRELMIQAGAFGEHRFTSVRYDVRTSEYPGRQTEYASPASMTEQRQEEVNESVLQLHLPPATEITLDLATQRFVNDPSYALPWQQRS
ncbi:MAG: hypothetical protein M1434_03170 [Chloroflexi bacterium]|nr:hypothetical protein [Chloroflexota bacterium]MCL5273730.1 hypothetical protein [Chloroflexota bacterium]